MKNKIERDLNRRNIYYQKKKNLNFSVSYLGCYEDRRVRLLDQQFIRMARLTISACKELCRKRKKKYAGVEVIHGGG